MDKKANGKAYTYTRPITAIFYTNPKKNEVLYTRHYRRLTNAVRMGMIELFQNGAPGALVEYVVAETGTQLGWTKVSARGDLSQKIHFDWDWFNRNDVF